MWMGEGEGEGEIGDSIGLEVESLAAIFVTCQMFDSRLMTLHSVTHCSSAFLHQTNALSIASLLSPSLPGGTDAAPR